MTGELKRARLGVSVVFAVCGAAFATWLARVPAVQERLGLSTGELAAGLFGLAAGSVLALLGAGALLTRIGSRAAVVLGAVVCARGCRWSRSPARRRCSSPRSSCSASATACSTSR
ncbi:hypothetical protein AB0F15_35095 [Amycolatopsis sp. NPDC026612]|uniref:hypothetical protein n=1 Tax=Amycolatopsis sp. NPDC026612 TaxID=3155466 RepID=UPI0033E42206